MKKNKIRINIQIRRFLVYLTTKIFPNLWGRLDDSSILFSKILQIFKQKNNRGLFDYYDVVSKEKKKI